MNRAFYIVIIPGVIASLAYVAVGWGARGLAIAGLLLGLAALLFLLLRRRFAQPPRPSAKL